MRESYKLNFASKILKKKEKGEQVSKWSDEIKFELVGHDDIYKAKMRIDFAGSSDISTIEVKWKNHNEFGQKKNREYEIACIGLSEMRALHILLNRFFDSEKGYTENELLNMEIK